MTPVALPGYAFGYKKRMKKKYSTYLLFFIYLFIADTKSIV